MKAEEILGVNNMLQAAEGSLQRPNWTRRDGQWNWDDDLADEETFVQVRHGYRLKRSGWQQPYARFLTVKGKVTEGIPDIHAATVWDCMIAAELWLKEQGVRVPVLED